MDETDRRLLRLLQRDSTATNQQLGAALNLSASQAGRRRQQLEASGCIDHYGAQLDAKALGLSVQAFVQVSLASHARDEAADFIGLCERLPEIVSVWTLTGEADYLLRIYCADLERLNRLLQGELLCHRAVARVQSQIVLDHVKRDTALPL